MFINNFSPPFIESKQTPLLLKSATGLQKIVLILVVVSLQP